MSDSKFTLTTKVRVTSPKLPTLAPTTPGVEVLKPRLQDLGSSCNLSDHASNNVDSQCEQTKIVTCFGNASFLRWKVGRKNHTRSVAECVNGKCPAETCWKVSASEDGIDLHLGLERKKSKRAFRCADSAEGAGVNLCFIKAVWD
ncbi:uncharacterized protein [Oscarella lobularis]|uniref:uncharacterized protein isoform X2 n=1 Tax=Oscarella lobularis TaxID=121494 RepID=UPI003313D1FF